VAADKDVVHPVADKEVVAEEEGDKNFEVRRRKYEV
jgi:hypothetical protein